MKEDYNMIIVMNEELGKLVYDKDTPKFLPINYGHYRASKLEDAVNYREALFDEKCEYIIKDFTWGKVLNFHPMTDYQIIEYRDEKGNRLFHTYVGFKDENCSFDTLDKAIIGGIVFKNVGFNSSLEYYIPKMLGMI